MAVLSVEGKFFDIWRRHDWPSCVGIFVNRITVFATVLAIGLLDEHLEASRAKAMGPVLGGIAIAKRGNEIG